MTAHLILALSTITAITSAAECSANKGNPHCITKEDVYAIREDLCGKDTWKQKKGAVRIDGSGTQTQIGQVSFEGVFNNVQECWDSTQNIIEQCLGKTDGGEWSLSGGVGLKVRFEWCLTPESVRVS